MTDPKMGRAKSESSLSHYPVDPEPPSPRIDQRDFPPRQRQVRLSFQLSTGRAVKCNSKYIVDDFFYIEIRKGFNHTGDYSLDSSSIRSIDLFANINKIDYGTDIRHPGILSISKLDTINKIISGTFESILFNIQNLQDSISLTEGRFDLSY
jgi:hypothetical protein